MFRKRSGHEAPRRQLPDLFSVDASIRTVFVSVYLAIVRRTSKTY
jgi:hypothetical protein